MNIASINKVLITVNTNIKSSKYGKMINGKIQYDGYGEVVIGWKRRESPKLFLKWISDFSTLGQDLTKGPD